MKLALDFDNIPAMRQLEKELADALVVVRRAIWYAEGMATHQLKPSTARDKYRLKRGIPLDAPKWSRAAATPPRTSETGTPPALPPSPITTATPTAT